MSSKCFPLEFFTNIFEQGEGNTDMVDWIGKFSLLLKRLKDAWMDMSPLSAMSQEQRESQKMADMTQKKC